MSETSRRFAFYKHKIESEMRRADELENQAQDIRARVRERRSRIEKGLPDEHACPNCWVERGQVNVIVAATADDPEHFDRWRCSARCGFYFDVPLD